MAAIALHGLEGEAPSIGAELLADVKAVFDDKRASKIFSADLLNALVADEEAPWATWNRGKPMSPRQLSAKLADFGAKSKQVRVGFETKKGYLLEDFGDAFARYLSAGTPSLSETPKQASNGAASSVSERVLSTGRNRPSETLQTSNHAGCFDVSDRHPLSTGRAVDAEEGGHLSVGTPSTSATPLQPSNGAASSVAQSATAPLEKSPSATRKATAGAGCSDVADKTPPHGKEGSEALPLWDDADKEEF